MIGGRACVRWIQDSGHGSAAGDGIVDTYSAYFDDEGLAVGGSLSGVKIIGYSFQICITIRKRYG